MDEVVENVATPEETSTTEEPSSDEKTMALLAHLGGILFWFVPALIIWLIKKDESKFIDHHGKEALNFQIFITIAWVVCVLLSFAMIGACLLPLVWIGGVIFCVLAAVAANKGEWYRYPVSIRVIT